MLPVTPNRECGRCGAKVFLTEPHLCADLARRLARREKQVAEVMRIMESWGLPEARAAAEEIVQHLAQIGVEND